MDSSGRANSQNRWSAQEVIEVRAGFSFSREGALKAAIDAALAEKPPHRIISLSVFSAGAESTTEIGAIIVIEYP